MSATPLRLPFIIGGIYAFLFGAIQMIPPLAERVYGRPIVDPAIESIWGITIVGLSGFYFMAASDAAKYKALTWVFIASLLLVVLNAGYYWSAGAYTAATILPFLLLNIALAVWLWLAYSRG